MTILKATIALVFLGVVAALVALNRRGKRSKATESRPAEIESPVQEPPRAGEDAAAAVERLNAAQSTQGEPREDLSQSGAMSVQAEIDRCVAAEHWEEAMKWAMHAIESLPEPDGFKVTLAELYARAEDRENFNALFEALAGELTPGGEHRKRLVAIAVAFAPDHPLLKRGKKRKKGASTPPLL